MKRGFEMNFFKKIRAALLLCAVVAALTSAAQTPQVGKNQVEYYLPRTVLQIELMAEHTSFKAGPYAAFAKKYLGIEVGLKDSESYTLKAASIMPYVEPDPETKKVVTISSKSSAESFFKYRSGGFLITSNDNAFQNVQWFAPLKAEGKIEDVPAVSNFTTKETELFMALQVQDRVEPKPVKQSYTVAKDLEMKAYETSLLINKLRAKRMDLISGESDEELDGNSVKAIIEEINRLERTYLEQFTGRSVKDTVNAKFYFLPDKSQLNRVAFRLSDQSGIVSPDLQGKPYNIKIENAGEAISTVPFDKYAEIPKNTVITRKPVTVMVKLMDGDHTLLQQRMPIWQLSEVIQQPLDGKKFVLF